MELHGRNAITVVQHDVTATVSPGVGLLLPFQSTRANRATRIMDPLVDSNPQQFESVDGPMSSVT